MKKIEGDKPGPLQVLYFSFATAKYLGVYFIFSSLAYWHLNHPLAALILWLLNYPVHWRKAIPEVSQFSTQGKRRKEKNKGKSGGQHHNLTTSASKVREKTYIARETRYKIDKFLNLCRNLNIVIVSHCWMLSILNLLKVLLCDR